MDVIIEFSILDAWPCVVFLGVGVGSLADREEVVDRSVGHLRNKFQVRLQR